MYRIFQVFFSLCLSLYACFTLDNAHSQPVTSPAYPDIKHVIYITLDGTRWQDIFTHHELPQFWALTAQRGSWYGQPGTNKHMRVASVPISLPSYQSQLAGKVQPCQTNECGRIQVETVAEYLVHAQHFAKQDVATFANWNEISNAVEHVPGTTYISAGNAPVIQPNQSQPDRIMSMLNQQQRLHPLEEKDRYDQYTFAQALHYFKQYQPRFLWIALGDADEAAHANDRHLYYRVLRFYDVALVELFKTLQAMRLDKNTLVIITTDHGRGAGKNWTSHGPEYPGSSQTWAFVMNGQLQAMRVSDGQEYYSTLSIRPTIEQAFLKNS